MASDHWTSMHQRLRIKTRPQAHREIALLVGFVAGTQFAIDIVGSYAHRDVTSVVWMMAVIGVLWASFRTEIYKLRRAG